MNQKNFYNVLGVNENCSENEIKKAFSKSAMQYHPDRNPGDKEAAKKFKEISEAYNVLKNKDTRAEYDNQRKYGSGFGNAGQSGGFSGFGQQGSGFQHSDIDDLFRSFFQNNMNSRDGHRRKKSAKVNGADLRYDMSITLEEAFKGVDKTIDFTTEIKCKDCDGNGSKSGEEIKCSKCHGAGAIRIQRGYMTLETTCDKCHGDGILIKDPCKTCRGTGRYNKTKSLKVHISKGIESGMRIRIVGEGEAGVRGGNNGDLYIFVTVKLHNIFKVQGNDLHYRIPVLFTKAILGGKVMISTIDQNVLEVKIDAGTNTGDKIRIKNYGMPKINSTMRGDLYLYPDVIIPKNITIEQEMLLKQIDNSFSLNSNYENSKKEEGFFDKLKNLKNFLL